MDNLTLCAPCLFGLEGVLADELRRLGMEEVRAENGRVLFSGNIAAASRANLWLRTAERVMIVAGEFRAESFEELFEQTHAIEWERWLPRDAAFPVRGHCVSSKLMSVPDCRSVIKRAVAARLGERYHYLRAPEDGSKYQLRFTVLRDRVMLHIDTSGASLHKRGYRALSGEAPLRETLAAGMVLLSRYRGKGAFRDPFCGSGTIAIEAALIAKNRAPGLLRGFDLSAWSEEARCSLEQERESAPEREFNGEYDIAGSDIDADCVALARENAAKAGVQELVRFEQSDALAFYADTERGRVVTNPPYGVRLGEAAEAAELMHEFGVALRPVLKSGWEAAILSADPELERELSVQASKRRKLYNGSLRCELYIFGRCRTR